MSYNLSKSLFAKGSWSSTALSSQGGLVHVSAHVHRTCSRGVFPGNGILGHWPPALFMIPVRLFLTHCGLHQMAEFFIRYFPLFFLKWKCLHFDSNCSAHCSNSVTRSQHWIRWWFSAERACGYPISFNYWRNGSICWNICTDSYNITNRTYRPLPMSWILFGRRIWTLNMHWRFQTYLIDFRIDSNDTAKLFTFC